MIVKINFIDMKTKDPLETILDSARVSIYHNILNGDDCYWILLTDHMSYSISKSDYDNISAILESTNNIPVPIKIDTTPQ